MKRTVIVALCIALAAVYGVPAQNWDLSIDSSLSATQLADTTVSATESAAFSTALSLGASAKLNIKLNPKLVADYAWTTGITQSDPLDWHDALPTEFQFIYSAPFKDEGLNQLSFQAGRMPYYDPTGALFSNKIDGMIFTFAYPAVSVWAVLGYTGYLTDTDAFVLGAADAVNGNDGFAPPRALASFGLKTKKIAGNEIYVNFIAQEDMRDDAQFIREHETTYDPFGGGPQDSAYLTGGFSGALGPRGSYSGFAVYQFGRTLSYVDGSYEYASVQAWSCGATFRLAFPPSLNASVRVQYGSGDADSDSSGTNTEGKSTYFFPITKASPGLVFAPQAGNIGLLEVGLNFVPFPAVSIGPQSVQFNAKTLFFLKAGKGSTSESTVETETGTKMLGIEQDVTCSLRLLSDLSFNLSAGLFLPFADPLGAFPKSYTEGSPLKYTVQAGMSLAL